MPLEKENGSTSTIRSALKASKFGGETHLEGTSFSLSRVIVSLSSMVNPRAGNNPGLALGPFDY